MENETVKTDHTEVPAQQPVSPAVKAAVTPAAKPVNKPVAKPVAKTALKPAAKPAVKTDVKPDVKTKSKQADKEKKPKAEIPVAKKQKREKISYELRIDLLGKAIKKARKDRKLTQKELGQLVGVKKAQISKLENSLTDARFETIIKVFKALNVKINFNVELLDQTVTLR